MRTLGNVAVLSYPRRGPVCGGYSKRVSVPQPTFGHELSLSYCRKQVAAPPSSISGKAWHSWCPNDRAEARHTPQNLRCGSVFPLSIGASSASSPVVHSTVEAPSPRLWHLNPNSRLQNGLRLGRVFPSSLALDLQKDRRGMGTAPSSMPRERGRERESRERERERHPRNDEGTQSQHRVGVSSNK